MKYFRKWELDNSFIPAEHGLVMKWDHAPCLMCRQNTQFYHVEYGQNMCSSECLGQANQDSSSPATSGFKDNGA